MSEGDQCCREGGLPIGRLTELMAALDGRRVILATDFSGRAKLRLLD